jgi:hypothetical protein
MADELSSAKLVEAFLAMERNSKLERTMTEELTSQISKERPRTEALQLGIGHLSLLAGKIWLFPNRAIANAHKLAAKHGWENTFHRIAQQPTCCGALRGLLPAKTRELRELARQPSDALEHHLKRLVKLEYTHPRLRERTAETLRSQEKVREILQPVIERELAHKKEQERVLQQQRERSFPMGRTRGRERTREREGGYER